MADLSKYSDDELMAMAGLSKKPASPDLSKFSDDELFRMAGIENPANKKVGVFGQVTQGEYDKGARNWLGSLVDRPAAASREAIKAEPSLALSGPLAGLIASSGIVGNKAKGAAISGAANPSLSKTFQQEALERAAPKTTDFWKNFRGGIIPSTVGLAADVATNPTEALASLIGLTPIGKGQTVASALSKSKLGQAAKVIGNSDVKQLPQAVREGIDIVRNVNPDAAVKSVDRAIKNVVTQGVNKGIRPTVVGKKSPRLQDKFYEDAADGVKAIVAAKDGLLVDDSGNALSKLPENLNEYSQAVGNLKSKIYAEYTKLAQEAGDNGVRFNTKPIIKELSTVANPKNTKFTPQERVYAQGLIDDIVELEGADPLTVQERIKKLNSSLQGYYAGKTDRMQASIDASVASLMRKQLDDSIEKSTGEQYRELKRLFGSLKAVENDVNHRAIVAARQAPKNVFDLVDVFSTGQATRGLMTGNPAEVLAAMAQTGVKNAFKAINNPDRIVKNMFRKAGALMEKRNYYADKMLPSFTGELVTETPKQILRKLLTGEAQKQIEDRSMKALPSPKTKYGEGFTARGKTFNDVVKFNRMLGKRKLEKRYKAGNGEELLKELWKRVSNE